MNNLWINISSLMAVLLAIGLMGEFGFWFNTPVGLVLAFGVTKVIYEEHKLDKKMKEEQARWEEENYIA